MTLALVATGAGLLGLVLGYLAGRRAASGRHHLRRGVILRRPR